MGRSSSKLLEIPNNPLQELQFEEKKRAQRKLQQEKDQKRIAKLQKKHAKRNEKKIKKHEDIQTKNTLSEPTQLVNGSNFQSLSCEINNDDLNRQIEQRMQTQLNSDLCTFIMNQISLTLQFFGNFESELVNTSEALLVKENYFNQHLEEHSILLSAPLDAAVTKWLKYRPVHGLNKNIPQPLQPQALYVIFENIDIARPNDANYDSISPLCKVDMDTEFYKTTPCKEDYIDMLREIKWKGYVRLRLREDPKASRQIENSRNSGKVYAHECSGYIETSKLSLNPLSIASSGYGSESDYDYAYIAYLNTHHPLSELKINHPLGEHQLNTKILPDSCVSTLANFIESCHEEESDNECSSQEEDTEYSDNDDSINSCHLNVSRRSRDNNKNYEILEAIKLHKIEQEHRKMLLQQSFLNSKEFMRYFGELVRQHLAERLHIPHADLENSTFRGSSIYTKNYELIPAIHVAQNAQHWPDCAFQFRIRERPISTNPLTGQQFQWPTRSMIRRIETFGFHVVPMGYAPKKQRNPFRELEWRIVFPKAERYLEQHLTNTQVKVFMMTKALVKTFIEPQEKNKALMFTMDHIRTHLFWECERNFTAWPEEFLGEVLLRFIKSFMQRLREKCLRDYFIEERNLFEGIPEYSLVTLYSILADITANPLMHLMVALRNLDFTENFYPKLNFKKVFENLVENDLLKLKMQAKNHRMLMESNNEREEAFFMLDEGAKGLVGMKQHREKTNGKLRRRTHLMRHNIEMKKKQELEQKRQSIESIDVELFFHNNLQNSRAKRINQGVENLRRTNILEIIVDHLLATAEKAIALRSAHIAKTYLAQARRLCKFYHNYGCDVGAKEYLNSIHCINEDIEALRDEFDTSPPTLPIRTSVEPITLNQSKELEEKLDLMRRSMRTQMDDSDEISNDCGSNITRKSRSEPYDNDILTHKTAISELNPRKSIKFIDHVVEVHEGDANPIQKSEIHNLIGILRLNTIGGKNVNDEINVANQANIQACGDSRKMLSNSMKSVEITADPPTMRKFNTIEGALGNDTFSGGEFLRSLTSSAEKVITSVKTEKTRAHLMDMVKHKAVRLQGTFNQSSES